MTGVLTAAQIAGRLRRREPIVVSGIVDWLRNPYASANPFSPESRSV